MSSVIKQWCGPAAAAKAIVGGATVEAQHGDWWLCSVQDDTPVMKASRPGMPGMVACDISISKCWGLTDQIAHNLACAVSEVAKSMTALNQPNRPARSPGAPVVQQPRVFATDNDHLALRIATNGGRLLRIEQRQQANNVMVYADADGSIARMVALWGRQAQMPPSTNLFSR